MGVPSVRVLAPMIRNRFYKLVPAAAIRYRRIIKYGFENEILFAENYLKNNPGLFIDVGAHLGVWSFWLARKTQPVWAFEPNPVLASILKRSQIPNTTVFDFGLGAFDGFAELKVPIIRGLARPGNGTVTDFRIVEENSVLSSKVSLRKLDGLATDKVAAMKIDCEGGEVDVIDGAREVIARDLPLIILEMHHDRTQDFERVLEKLPLSEYSVQYLDSGTLHPFQWQGRPQSVENLIFLPATS